MEDKYTDDALINMLSLNEEISSLNVKVKQLVEDVHADKPLLVNLKELTRELNQKIDKFSKSINSYKPKELPETEPTGVPSYLSENKERERVKPGPGDPVPYDTPLTPAKVDAGGPLPIEELITKKEEIKDNPPRKAPSKRPNKKTNKKTNKQTNKAEPKRRLFSGR